MERTGVAVCPAMGRGVDNEVGSGRRMVEVIWLSCCHRRISRAYTPRIRVLGIKVPSSSREIPYLHECQRPRHEKNCGEGTHLTYYRGSKYIVEGSWRQGEYRDVRDSPIEQCGEDNCALEWD